MAKRRYLLMSTASSTRQQLTGLGKQRARASACRCRVGSIFFRSGGSVQIWALPVHLIRVLLCFRTIIPGRTQGGHKRAYYSRWCVLLVSRVLGWIACIVCIFPRPRLVDFCHWRINWSRDLGRSLQLSAKCLVTADAEIKEFAAENAERSAIRFFLFFSFFLSFFFFFGGGVSWSTCEYTFIFIIQQHFIGKLMQTSSWVEENTSMRTDNRLRQG